VTCWSERNLWVLDCDGILAGVPWQPPHRPVIKTWIFRTKKEAKHAIDFLPLEQRHLAKPIRVKIELRKLEKDEQ